MALLLAKKLSSSSFQFATPHLRLTLLPLLQFSTVATEPKGKDPSFMTQYLISSFGFSSDRALKLSASSFFGHVKTPDRPEAVVCFLKETGLTDAQIRSLINWNPQLLCYSVSNVLEPHVRKLEASGFTGEMLTRLIQICPSVLILNMAAPRLRFWRDFFKNDASLLLMIRRNYRLLQYDIDEVVLPIVNMLKDYGFSDVDIRRLYTVLGSRLKSSDIAKKYIEETEAMGFKRDSRMFPLGLMVVGKCNRDTIVCKLEFMRNLLGWSDQELHCAFRRFPTLVCLSEKTIKSKTDFLLNSVGLTKQEICAKPQLFGYSLERRMVPRHHVLSLLNLKDIKVRAGLCTVVALTESDFLKKYVRPFEDAIPGLGMIYAASCQGRISS